MTEGKKTKNLLFFFYCYYFITLIYFVSKNRNEKLKPNQDLTLDVLLNTILSRLLIILLAKQSFENKLARF